MSTSPTDARQAIIGPKNQTYYLERFARFDRTGKAGASWHWPAFFFTLFWLMYRRMWAHAGLYFLLSMGIPALSRAAGNGDGSAAALAVVLGLSLWIIPPIYANALYYWYCRRKIEAVARTEPDPQRQLAHLARQGGTSRLASAVAAIFFGILLLGVLARTAIPAYQDYMARIGVAEAAALGDDAIDFLYGYYEDKGDIPGDFVAAGFTSPLPVSVRELHMNGPDELQITLAGSHLEGHSLRFVAIPDESGDARWVCRGDGLPEKYLPAACRQEEPARDR